MDTRKEIRIVNPDDRVLTKVKKRAKDNKRTIGKEAEWIISQYLTIDESIKKVEL